MRCSYVELRITPAVRNAALHEARGGQVCCIRFFLMYLGFSLNSLQSSRGRVAPVDVYRPLIEVRCSAGAVVAFLFSILTQQQSLIAPGVVVYSNCIVLHVVIPGSSAEQLLQR